MFELTVKQKEGLELAVQKYHNHEKYVIIAGYAGTGKSNLVKYIIEALPVNPQLDVAYVSFTGKAVNVLQQKGNPNCMTLHKIMYNHSLKPDGTYRRTKKKNLGYKVLVVDEASMIDKKMGEQLLSYTGTFFIFLGDPGQLPPIYEDAHILEHPDIFLDEIMRQEADNDIIAMSQKVRHHEKLPSEYHGSNLQIYSKVDEELLNGMFLWADIILCATNKTRLAVNTRVRALLGKKGIIDNGDKVICLKNDWDIVSKENQEPLVNGTIGTIDNIFESGIPIPRYCKTVTMIPTFNFCLKTDYNETFEGVRSEQNIFINGKSLLDGPARYRITTRVKDIVLPDEFDYGYCVTAWKAQGSEWRNVLVLEEGFPYDSEEHDKWLYTALTRSYDKCVLIKK